MDVCESDVPTEEIDNEFPRRFTEEFGIFLAEADAYLDFGLLFQPRSIKGATLLDPDEVWHMPEEIYWPDSERRPAPLTDILLKMAKTYRAPIAGA